MRTAAPRPLRRLRLPRRAVALGALALAALLALGLWVRHSPLVAATRVEISGTSGPQSAAMRAAIRDAAQGMSTLAVDPGRIASALRRWSIVRDVEVHGHFPHTLTVRVDQHVPVAALTFADEREAVASDGTLLPDVSTRGLPAIPVDGAPGGKRLTERRALRIVALLGAAPTALRRHVDAVGAPGGELTVTLARGPKLYFGPATRLRAKWISAATVLADRSSRGARYIDVRVPERPAAGGLEPINPQAEVESLDQG
ncbi:MAG TPA: FtsQ-type POTRA domain-containing protein [Solirubrobacteraceae bacterium]|jgi:cell division protein FtsQ|nr:FtsQ-type POTRA domain-containing protein [Solirubrobacteraceae bacterium]